MHVIDPRSGDVEDDASSTKQRSLRSLAGSLAAEVSLPKLVAAWTMLIAIPGVLLGLTSLLGSIWLRKLFAHIPSFEAGIESVGALAALAAAAYFGGASAFRLAEKSFWSLHALGIQPGYVFVRELLRHFAESWPMLTREAAARSRTRAACALASGLAISLLSALVAASAWPFSHWTATPADLLAPTRLIAPAIANAVLIVACYFSAASLVWGVADARMPAPLDLAGFDEPRGGTRQWRIAHLSDIHAVAGAYGFRLECGRAGPRGNDRFAQVLARLDEAHREQALDAILVTGDLTDAGSSTEWAAFFDALRPYPQLAARLVALPGNHDLNVVDRANPARLELPTSPLKRLRQLRMLSALCEIQGDRAHVLDPQSGRLGPALNHFIEPHRADILRFSDTGALSLSVKLRNLFDDAFPMIVPPKDDGELGIVVFNSNADTHFSFTNALGLVSRSQLKGIRSVTAQYPNSAWLIALHHHLVEYPTPTKELSERIGTALINGSQVLRRLQKLGGAIVMHGHRHTEWIGTCGALTIVSASSPVMSARDSEDSHFYIHTLTAGPGGRVALHAPQTISLPALALSSESGMSVS